MHDAWSPPFGDWAAGQYFNMITTTALLKTLRVKVIDWPSMSPDLNPIEHLWGILKWKVEERKVFNIHQLRDIVMEEWKRTPVATCGALVNSMPKRVKAVLENNGGHTKYWHFGPNLDIFTFVASGLYINGCVLSYFEGTANLHCYTSCTLTTLHCSKVSFLQCCHMKRYKNINKNVRGVLTSVRYCVYIYIYIYFQLMMLQWGRTYWIWFFNHLWFLHDLQ